MNNKSTTTDGSNTSSINFLSTISLSCIMFATAACNNQPTSHNAPTLEPREQIVQSTSSEVMAHMILDDKGATPEGIRQVVNASNQFAIDMYQQVSTQDDHESKNIFFSPYSLSTAVAMLYNAADGDIKQQIGQVFHYPDLSVLNPNSGALYNRFNAESKTAKPDYKLSTTNQLWLAQTLTPKASFVQTIRQYYGGDVTNLDFAGNPEPSRLTINKAIAAQTNQMIPALLPEGSITVDTVSVLTNAIYFKGDWQTPFEKASTYAQPFHRFDGQISQVDMMAQTDDFHYAEDDSVQVLQLPYKGDALSMLIVLPKSTDKTGMQKLVAKLTPDMLAQWSTQLSRQEVIVRLPKFKLAEEYEMKPLLQSMGMVAPFKEGGGIDLFENSPPLKVDDIYHKAVVEVDETGTEAAAATGITASAASASIDEPVQFTADHPFMFMIKDNETGAILFMGQVNKPQ